LDVEQNQLCGFRLPLAGHVAFGLQSNHLLLLQLKIQTGKSARQTQNSFFYIFYLIPPAPAPTDASHASLTL
jgi:hypothetical protein